MKSRLRDRIAEEIAPLPVVNHHEHAWQSFSRRHAPEFDLPYFLTAGYLSGDLQSAGWRPPEGLFAYLSDPGAPDGAEKAWHSLRPFLDRVRSTIYFRYLLRSLQDLFAVTEEDLFSDRWQDASRKLRHYSQEHRGQGAELCSRMQVDVTVLDGKLEPDQLAQVDHQGHCVLHISRLDMFIHEERGLAETLTEHDSPDFAPWLDLFEGKFRAHLEAGAAGFKSGLAYNREIAYADPSRDQAAHVFENGLLTASPEDKRLYQDFMMNRLCRLCVEAGVPLQIHTGLQAGLRGRLEDTRPTLLTELFQRHGDLRVDLFHGGYPWTVQAGLMAKYFPHVYVDGCWLSHISPSAYREALTAWIETVPLNKILAWGGDHNLLEHSYASLALTKDLVAEVLADLVERDYFDLPRALDVAQHILHDNGIEFWGVKE